MLSDLWWEMVPKVAGIVWGLQTAYTVNSLSIDVHSLCGLGVRGCVWFWRKDYESALLGAGRLHTDRICSYHPYPHLQDDASFRGVEKSWSTALVRFNCTVDSKAPTHLQLPCKFSELYHFKGLLALAIFRDLVLSLYRDIHNLYIYIQI